MKPASHRSSDSCPFIDDAHPDCDGNFTISRLSAAFSQCAGAYRSCPNYWRLARQQPQRLIFITAHGRALTATAS